MNDTSKAYWIGVGKRLSGLAKKAVSMSIPIAVSAGIDKACGAINCKLREIYKTSIVNALITLALKVAGLLCVLYCPFGIVPSRYLAAFLFIASLVWSCVRLVEYLRKYGKETLAVCKSVLAQKSVSRGLDCKTYFAEFFGWRLLARGLFLSRAPSCEFFQKLGGCAYDGKKDYASKR